MIKIVCISCHKPLSIDEMKLPMREVGFPCPNCKAKLTFDRRTLGDGGAAAEEPHSAASLAAIPMPEAGTALADEPGRYGPKALLVGADHPALHQAARSVGLYPVYFPTAAEGREYFLQEYPAAVFLFPQPLPQPPLESMAPLLSVTPADRRKGFYILFADSLRTLDGNAAFVYNVNLIVATKDIGSFAQVFRDAMTYHERLYTSMNAVQKQLHMV